MEKPTNPVERLRETARAYRRVFATEDGQRLREDLRAQFGYGKPSARAGMRNEEVWLAEGMKLPLLHIDRMLADDLAPKKGAPAKR